MSGFCTGAELLGVSALGTVGSFSLYLSEGTTAITGTLVSTVVRSSPKIWWDDRRLKKPDAVRILCQEHQLVELHTCIHVLLMKL